MRCISVFAEGVDLGTGGGGFCENVDLAYEVKDS